MQGRLSQITNDFTFHEKSSIFIKKVLIIE